MKKNGPVLCVEDLRLAEQEKRQEWRKEQTGRERAGRDGPGRGGGGQSRGELYNVPQNPLLIITYSLHCSSFLGLPFRVLNMKLVEPKKGTTMETVGKAPISGCAGHSAVVGLVGPSTQTVGGLGSTIPTP